MRFAADARPQMLPIGKPGLVAVYGPLPTSWTRAGNAIQGTIPTRRKLRPEAGICRLGLTL